MIHNSPFENPSKSIREILYFFLQKKHFHKPSDKEGGGKGPILKSNGVTFSKVLPQACGVQQKKGKKRTSKVNDY